MQTNIHEIADGVYRLSTCVPEVAPGGFTFNQYLIDADEPFLFHTGPRQMFDLVAPAAVGQVLDVERLRWISFGHVESDECGAMNLLARGRAGRRGRLQRPRLRRVAERPVRPAAASVAGRRRALDIGGHGSSRMPRRPTSPTAGRRRWSSTRPPAPSSAATCSRRSATAPRSSTTSTSSAAPLAAEDMFHGTGLTPDTAPTLRRLADLEPRTLAIMHGPAFVGDCQQALLELADAYEARFRAACEQEAAA